MLPRKSTFRTRGHGDVARVRRRRGRRARSRERPPPRAREPAVSLFNHRLRAFSPSRSSRVARRARARSRANGLAETRGKNPRARACPRAGRRRGRRDRARVDADRACVRSREFLTVDFARSRSGDARRARLVARVPTRSRTDPSRGGALLFDESCLVNVSPATRE